MKKIFGFVAVLTLGLTLLVQDLRAEVFVWRDPDTRMTVSFPDSWRLINNQNPDDILTVRAPGDGEFAECKLHVTDEARYRVYPRFLADDVQQEYVSADFWSDYLGQYNNARIIEGTDNNGLGRGYASMAQSNYTTAKGAKMQKRSIGFASHYMNHIYTVECSAEASAYHKWHNAFLSFVKSVDFYKGSNFAITGYYRDFLNDKVLKVRGPHVFEDTYY